MLNKLIMEVNLNKAAVIFKTNITAIVIAQPI